MGRFYVTTPIYYVNDRPHIGHAYTTVLADVLARYHRLVGDDVFFLTGTDEHGQKVQRAAAKAGQDPQAFVDETHAHFKALWDRLGISHDRFIRTTDPDHVEFVRAALRKLHENGDIYLGEHEGLYDVASESFVAPTEVGMHPIGSLVEVKEPAYYFRMARHQEWLVDYIGNAPGFVQPDFRRNEVLGFLRKPLQDLCISRPKSRLSWGIEIPFDADYVAYVWFDALLNYISPFEGSGSRFDELWPNSLHLVGKDILTFHAVYWPIMLRALGLPPSKSVFAHGWWVSSDRGRKIGKSVGNAARTLDLVDDLGADAFRYLLVDGVVPGQDGAFSRRRFVERYNARLANDLGNALNRVVGLVVKNRGGSIPRPNPSGSEDDALRDAVLGDAAESIRHAVDLRPDLAVEAAARAAGAVNRYIEVQKPWETAKTSPDRFDTTIYNAAEALRVIGGVLHPVMPGKMGDLLEAVGSPREPSLDCLLRWGVTPAGVAVASSGPLFPRAGLPQDDV